jgi:molecular chaperone HtpG
VALRRWCRHAGLPIRYVVPAPGVGGTGEPLVDERIDCPLSLETALSVTQEVDGELIVVGPSAGSVEPESPTFAGFYNRGLTLFETTQPPVPALTGIHLKIQSPHLQHTLSRDNVRHDEAYERVIREAEDIVAGPLRRKLEVELAAAARAVADGTDEDTFARLLTAACQPPVRLDLDEIAVPLIVPLGRRHVLSLHEALALGDGTLYVASLTGDLTGALARTHTPVVHVVHGSEITSLTGRLEPGRVQHIQQAFLLAEEVATDALSPSDQALCRATLEALLSAGTRIGRVGMANTTGLEPPRGALAVAADAAAPAHLFSRHEAATWWARWGAPKVLLLATAHEAVKRARARAEYSPAVAANLLARALLVEERGALAKRASDQLLAAGSKALARGRRRAPK